MIGEQGPPTGLSCGPRQADALDPGVWPAIPQLGGSVPVPEEISQSGRYAPAVRKTFQKRLAEDLPARFAHACTRSHVAEGAASRPERGTGKGALCRCAGGNAPPWVPMPKPFMNHADSQLLGQSRSLCCCSGATAGSREWAQAHIGAWMLDRSRSPHRRRRVAPMPAAFMIKRARPKARRSGFGSQGPGQSACGRRRPRQHLPGRARLSAVANLPVQPSRLAAGAYPECGYRPESVLPVAAGAAAPLPAEGSFRSTSEMRRLRGSFGSSAIRFSELPLPVTSATRAGCRPSSTRTAG
jgi:hypothetical protein